MLTHSIKTKELSHKYAIETLCIALADKNGKISTHSNTESNIELVYPLYSITKTFISVLLLKLAEENKIHLDDKVSTWIPDAPESDRYSVRQLLNNTSGLPDYFMSNAYDISVRTNPSSPWTREDFIQNTYQGELLFDPGKGWMYSNLGYMFLKEIVEKLCGKKLSNALTEYIFEPLHLKSCKVLNETSDWHSLVPAYSTHLTLDGKTKEVSGLYHPNWVAHGVIAATATDVAQFFHHIFLGNFLHQKSLAEMKTLVRVPGDHPPAVTPSYGLGIMGDPNSQFGKVYGHGGGGPGYALHANYWEEIKGGTVIVALGNNEHTIMSSLMLDLVQEF